jgi:alkylation response protein AidB-like acyl-CoA dehydrogenase
LLPKENQGLTITQHPAISGGALGTLSFDEVFLPGESILSERPQGWLAPAFRLARIAAAAELTGLATWALDTTIAYAGNRVQFDKSILANQAVRHQLVDMWIQLQLAQAALRRAADSHASDDGNAYRDSLAAKIRSSDAADLICRKAIQFHGAIGYTAEYPLGGVIRRSLALNAWLGTPTTLRRRYVLDIARQELTHG